MKISLNDYLLTAAGVLDMTGTASTAVVVVPVDSWLVSVSFHNEGTEFSGGTGDWFGEIYLDGVAVPVPAFFVLYEAAQVADTGSVYDMRLATDSSGDYALTRTQATVHVQAGQALQINSGGEPAAGGAAARFTFHLRKAGKVSKE